MVTRATLGKTLIAGGLIGLLIGVPVMAQQRFESPNYTIDASVGNTFGGASSSTSYNLTSSGGESLIGSGQGGSYLLGEGYVTELNQAMQLTVQPSGLAAYYSFQEFVDSTAVYDDSANSNRGVVAGVATREGGKIGQGLKFNGVDTVVNAGDPAPLRIANTITISAWVNVTNNSNYQGIVSKGSTRYELAADFRTGADLSWRSSATTTTNFTGFFDGFTGSLVHVVVVADGTSLTAYRNGVSVGTINITAVSTGSEDFILGNRSGTGSFPFNGTLDHLKIFSRALTTEEIKAEYDAQSAGRASGLSLNRVTPGISETAAYDTIVQTDGPSYALSVSQDQDLTSGANTIPAAPGSITTPQAWSEGTTKGLGFTLISTNATALDSKWGTGTNYAALPSTATSYYTRTGYTAGTKDILNLRLRLDVPTNQATGTYTNSMVMTGTVTP